MEEGLKNGFPPSYIMRGEAGFSMKPKRWGSKGGKCVWAYAVAVTTALMVTVVVGALYYHRSIDGLLEAAQRPQSADRPILLSAPVVPQSAAAVNNVVVIDMEGDMGVSGSQAAIDYSKGLTAVYDASKKMCYLASGIHTDIANSKLPSVFPTSKYSVDQSYSISDKSLVPAPLQRTCAGIPLHWLEQVVRDAVHSVKKRATITVAVCETICISALTSIACQTTFISLCPTLCVALSENLDDVPVVGPILDPLVDSLGLSLSVSVVLQICIGVCIDIPPPLPLPVPIPLPAILQCPITACGSICDTVSAALAISPGNGPAGQPAGPPGGQ